MRFSIENDNFGFLQEFSFSDPGEIAPMVSIFFSLSVKITQQKFVIKVNNCLIENALFEINYYWKLQNINEYELEKISLFSLFLKYSF